MAHEVRLRDGAAAILQRPVTEAEFSAFDAIYAGTEGTLDQRLTSSFAAIADEENASTVRTVISFYQVFYGRQPDAGGLNYWTDLVDSGAVSLNELANEFSSASEFNSRFGDRTPVEVVAAQYANVLGRSPDAEGLRFWADQVRDGQLTLADLGRFFATSDEAQARFDPFIDAFLVNVANGTQDFDTNVSLFQEEIIGGTTVSLAGQTGPVVGGGAGDVFLAESGDITSSSNIDGEGANDGDTLVVFNETQGNAISPTMESVETVVWTEQTNDRASNADNNVGGYNVNPGDATTGVDVELDAGRISDVLRWEDYDSRADLVIEDIRDDDDVNGTFTGALTVAMVSTDPGNVDYATYFDEPVNRANDPVSQIFLRLIDADNARTTSQAGLDGSTPSSASGVLLDGALENFTITFNGQTVIIEVDPLNDPRVVGTQASYASIAQAIQDALDADPIVGGDLVASVDGPFREVASVNNPNVPEGTSIFGLQIQIDSRSGAELEAVRVQQFANDPDSAIIARIRDESTQVADELIRLNIDLDDVGKGSMGGDLLAGAMSTGRQIGDDGTSDSQGIQQFDIRVDRSSQLQTINSTNNALEVVNIVNGENAGPNNTVDADDEMMGSLVVRGRANPDVTDGPGGTNVNSSSENVATDNAMPGALPQHDDFGFNDVRVINASQMNGAVDLTVDLSNQIVEKYLENDDIEVTGDRDDELFSYNLGRGNDEFLVNMSADALIDVGTASREDFNLVINGNAGNDSIVTNVGTAVKFIDNQGQDFYDLNESGAWYSNQANNDAASFRVTGGDGNDTIWTHGWGDALIAGGLGSDTIYTDNSGTVDRTDPVLDIFRDLTRNITENDGRVEQIDYQVGAVWTFNDDNGDDDNVSNISGATNDGVNIDARLGNTVYTTNLTVSFFGANGEADDATAYTATVLIPQSAIGTDGNISDQVLTQAIKRAVNDDAVLNKVLEAVDGPGQSLAVYSKIDGDFENDDFEISLFETQRPLGGGPLSTRDYNGLLNDAGYDTSGDSGRSDFELFGQASVAESDNTISIRADGVNDVTVLSTNVTDLDDDDDVLANNATGITNGASNETLVFAEAIGGVGFGTETIFNFGAGNDDGTNVGAEDRFDFSAISYVAGTSGFSDDGTANQGNNSVSLIAQDDINNNNNEVAVANLFSASANTTALEHIVIVYDDNAGTFDTADNTGTVYLVNNPVGAGASASVQGQINLIGTEWTDLDANNFVDLDNIL